MVAAKVMEPGGRDIMQEQESTGPGGRDPSDWKICREVAAPCE